MNIIFPLLESRLESWVLCKSSYHGLFQLLLGSVMHILPLQWEGVMFISKGPQQYHYVPALVGWSLVKNMEWKWILSFLRIADQRLEIFQISTGAFFLYWQGDLCISAPQCYRWIGAFEEKKKEKASTILFVVKTLHRRSKSSIGLRKISQEYYDEKVSGKGGFYSKWYLLESVQRVTHHSPLRSLEIRKKSWNLHHSLSFRGDLLLLLGENCICSFLDAFVRSRTWRKGERE